MKQSSSRPFHPADHSQKKEAFFFFLQDLVKDVAPPISLESLQEMATHTESFITSSYAKPKRLRPSARARQLRAFTNSTSRAATALKSLGNDGFQEILNCSFAGVDSSGAGIELHLDYLMRMSRWAQTALEIAEDESRKSEDHKGGRVSDNRLESIIVVLMEIFRRQLNLIPTHSIDPESGLGKSRFDQFLAKALHTFGPEDATREPGMLDAMVRKLLETRDYQPYDPPKPIENSKS